MRRLGKWKYGMVALCLTGCMLFLGGCGAVSKSYDTMASVTVSDMNTSGKEMDRGYDAESAMEAEIFEETADVANSAAALNERKLIKTVDISVETKEFELVMSTVEQQVNAVGGYIENLDTYNGSTYSGYHSARNASMTIRIPKDKLNSFLENVSEVSNVVSRSENVDDVTLVYVDIESRRNALQTEQSRLLELLEQAESIEDIITIEERLSNVRYELESMESQLRTYDNKVDYSTVYLHIDEVRELTPIAEETAWQRITDGFVKSLRNIGNGCVEFAIWFVVHIPYIVLWAVFLAAAILVGRGIGKKRRAREQKKSENGKQ